MKYITLYVAGLLLVAACSRKTEDPSATVKEPVSDEVVLTEAQIRNADIATGRAEQKELTSTLRVNGILEVHPENRLTVSIPFGGYVREMKLIPGTRVVKGQLLATLEDPQYIQLQQDYLMARSRLDFLAADYERQRLLNSDKTSSDKAFQEVSSEFSAQKILVQSHGERLRLLDIDPALVMEKGISCTVMLRSPMNGFISAVNVTPGKYVTPTDVLLEIVDATGLHLSLTVFEKDMPYLSVGQEVAFTVSSRPGEKYYAEIALVNPIFDGDRKAEVHCHLARNDVRLLPGMFVNADIDVVKEKAYALPDDAIVRLQNKHYVFISRGSGRYSMTEIQTGISSGGFTAINGDLPDGEIVVRNAYTLLMKLRGDQEE